MSQFKSPFEIAAALMENADFRKLSPERQQAVFNATIASVGIGPAEDDLATLEDPEAAERIRRHRQILEGGRSVGGQVQMPQRTPMTPQGAPRMQGGQRMTPAQEEEMLENSGATATTAALLASGGPLAGAARGSGVLARTGRFLMTPGGDAAIAGGGELARTGSLGRAAGAAASGYVGGRLLGGGGRGIVGRLLRGGGDEVAEGAARQGAARGGGVLNSAARRLNLGRVNTGANPARVAPPNVRVQAGGPGPTQPPPGMTGTGATPAQVPAPNVQVQPGGARPLPGGLPHTPRAKVVGGSASSGGATTQPAPRTPEGTSRWTRGVPQGPMSPDQARFFKKHGTLPQPGTQTPTPSMSPEQARRLSQAEQSEVWVRAREAGVGGRLTDDQVAAFLKPGRGSQNAINQALAMKPAPGGPTPKFTLDDLTEFVAESKAGGTSRAVTVDLLKRAGLRERGFAKKMVDMLWEAQ